MLVIQSKKINYDTKVNEIENKITDHTHDKYITTPEFNKLTSDLVTKTDFDNKLTDLDIKIVSNKTKDLVFENEFKNQKQLLKIN